MESLLAEPREELFARAVHDGLAAVPASDRRGHLTAVAGEVAEAVGARVLDATGFTVFAQQTVRGGRGVDLLYLTPEENVLVVEVKGTLREGQIPRLGRSRLKQMSAAWLDAENAPMLEWELEAADVYGAVMIIDLVAAAARVAVTSDYETFAPVADLAVIDELLDRDAP